MGGYIICCGVGLLTEIVFGNLLNSISLIFVLLPEFSQGKVVAYMEEPTESASLISSLASYINGLIFILLFIHIRKKYFIGNNGYNILLNLYVFVLAFTRIILHTIPYLARFNMCVAGAFILLVAIALQHTNRMKILWVIGLCLFMFMSLRSKINSYPDLHIPYYSIWSNNNYR